MKLERHHQSNAKGGYFEEAKIKKINICLQLC